MFRQKHRELHCIYVLQAVIKTWNVFPKPWEPLSSQRKNLPEFFNSVNFSSTFLCYLHKYIFYCCIVFFYF